MLSKFFDLLQRASLALGFLLLTCLSGEVYAKNKTLLSDNNPAVGKIGSKVIRLRDIEDKRINDLRKQLYEALNAKLSLEIINRLNKKYPEFSTSSKVEISDREIRQFYLDNNLERHGPLKSLTPKIKEYLTSKALLERRQKLYEKALKKKLAVSYLKEPNDFLVVVPVASAYLRGNEKAKVILLEFSDYQCPYCSRVQQILSELREKYKGKVIFGYRHLPLAFHKEADEASIAVECARDQGQFDAYHETLFQNQRKQQISDLKKYARQIKIKNLKRFDACLDNRTYKERVSKDLQTAAKFGINGAPGFVIGVHDKKNGTVVGEIITGSLPKRNFVQILDKYLKKVERGN